MGFLEFDFGLSKELVPSLLGHRHFPPFDYFITYLIWIVLLKTRKMRKTLGKIIWSKVIFLNFITDKDSVKSKMYYSTTQLKHLILHMLFLVLYILYHVFHSSHIFVFWFLVFWSLWLHDFLSVISILPILSCKM